MRRLILALAVAGAIPAPASATLVRVPSPIPQAIVRDTVSGLDWIVAFPDYLAAHGSAGWRVATTDEVCGLMSQAAVFSGCGVRPAPTIGIEAFTSILPSNMDSSFIGGSDGSGIGFVGSFNDGSSAPAFGVAWIGTFHFVACDPIGNNCHGTTSFEHNLRFAQTSDVSGYWIQTPAPPPFLVRAVPEPGTAALVAFGLAPLALARRRY